ncbi:MAG: gamma-glutamyl-gamma-aminobutyrate hydrolase family protein [Chloroflexi bacterium]|nr:gamma-glutamyl-gamma-aminobutyrate hydrolase family protein [Chloroflexota bacterium]
MSGEVLVLRHVPHEHHGSLATAFARQGVGVRLVDMFADPPAHLALDGVAGLVVMGGPMNVDETARYPFLATEAAVIERALGRGLPVLGICLGSQLLAKALGARVYPNTRKEIGWWPIFPTAAARDDPLARPIAEGEVVFHWHGDTFDLPEGATLLAGSAACRHQAFRYGRTAYGLQFHVETTPEMIAAWLAVPENRAELAALPPDQAVDLAALHAATRRHSGRLAAHSAQVGATFCGLLTRPAKAP